MVYQYRSDEDPSPDCLRTGRSLMSKTQPEPRPFVEDRQAERGLNTIGAESTQFPASAQDGTYHIQFVCATPGVYEITACVDGVALPMCQILGLSQHP